MFSVIILVLLWIANVIYLHADTCYCIQNNLNAITYEWVYTLKTINKYLQLAETRKIDDDKYDILVLHNIALKNIQISPTD